jgi:hypothetical protein
MPSSDSGFQYLSQAALSRSRFLRLAAGVLIPFVGLRLSAAAAPNPDLAQNSGAPGAKDTAVQGRMGAILVSQFGPIKIHSYLSPADGFHVNTQMIEGPTAVVIFDGQLLLAALLPEQKVLNKALQDYDTITIGHDTPVHRFAIDSTITYVKRAREIHAASADAKAYSESLKAAFPDRQLASMVDFSASLLYAAPR